MMDKKSVDNGTSKRNTDNGDHASTSKKGKKVTGQTHKSKKKEGSSIQINSEISFPSISKVVGKTSFEAKESIFSQTTVNDNHSSTENGRIHQQDEKKTIKVGVLDSGSTDDGSKEDLKEETKTGSIESAPEGNDNRAETQYLNTKVDSVPKKVWGTGAISFANLLKQSSNANNSSNNKASLEKSDKVEMIMHREGDQAKDFNKIDQNMKASTKSDVAKFEKNRGKAKNGKDKVVDDKSALNDSNPASETQGSKAVSKPVLVGFSYAAIARSNRNIDRTNNDKTEYSKNKMESETNHTDEKGELLNVEVERVQKVSDTKKEEGEQLKEHESRQQMDSGKSGINGLTVSSQASTPATEVDVITKSTHNEKPNKFDEVDNVKKNSNTHSKTPSASANSLTPKKDGEPIIMKEGVSTTISKGKLHKEPAKVHKGKRQGEKEELNISSDKLPITKSFSTQEEINSQPSDVDGTAVKFVSQSNLSSEKFLTDNNSTADGRMDILTTTEQNKPTKGLSNFQHISSIEEDKTPDDRFNDENIRSDIISDPPHAFLHMDMSSKIEDHKLNNKFSATSELGTPENNQNGKFMVNPSFPNQNSIPFYKARAYSRSEKNYFGPEVHTVPPYMIPKGYPFSSLTTNKALPSRNKMEKRGQDPNPLDYHNKFVEQCTKLAIRQIEYYFTEENLCRDSYLRSFLDIDGYVPLSLIVRFPSVSRYQATYEDILWMIQALNKEAGIDPERSSSKTNVMIAEVANIENEKSSSTSQDENRSESKELSNPDDIMFQGEDGRLLIELDVERELLRLKNGNFSMYLMKQNDGTMGRPQWDINEYYNSKNIYFHQNEINSVRKRSLNYFTGNERKNSGNIPMDHISMGSMHRNPNNKAYRGPLSPGSNKVSRRTFDLYSYYNQNFNFPTDNPYYGFRAHRHPTNGSYPVSNNMTSKTDTTLKGSRFDASRSSSATPGFDMNYDGSNPSRNSTSMTYKIPNTPSNGNGASYSATQDTSRSVKGGKALASLTSKGSSIPNSNTEINVNLANTQGKSTQGTESLLPPTKSAKKKKNKKKNKAEREVANEDGKELSANSTSNTNGGALSGGNSNLGTAKKGKHAKEKNRNTIAINVNGNDNTSLTSSPTVKGLTTPTTMPSTPTTPTASSPSSAICKGEIESTKGNTNNTPNEMKKESSNEIPSGNGNSKKKNKRANKAKKSESEGGQKAKIIAEKLKNVDNTLDVKSITEGKTSSNADIVVNGSVSPTVTVSTVTESSTDGSHQSASDNEEISNNHAVALNA